MSGPRPMQRGGHSAFILRFYFKTYLAIGFGADKGEACVFQHARGGHGCSVAIDRADNLHADWQTG